MKQTWKIPVTWEVCGIARVDADTLEEAIRHVMDDPDSIPLPKDGEYVDASFRCEVEDWEIEAVRMVYNNGKPDLLDEQDHK